MSEPIGVGDWVECIRTAGPVSAASWLGRIFQVSEVGAWRDQTFINCHGLPKPTSYPGWAAECFRPIYRPKRELIEALSKPVSVSECV